MYVRVVPPSAGVTVTAIALSPTASAIWWPAACASPSSGVAVTMAFGSLGSADTVVTATSCATAAAYASDPASKAPKSIPDSCSVLSVAPGETDRIVTVADPPATPPCDGVIVTVSGSSSSSSANAANSATAVPAPAGSVSNPGLSS